jgi:hypothetical protein
LRDGPGLDNVQRSGRPRVRARPERGGEMMRWSTWSLVLGGSALLVAGACPIDGSKADRPPLEMSKAVVCKKVVGYEDFVELPDASLTSEDKLNVYFRLLNFRVDPVDKPKPGSRFKARFTEDCRIRRKGEKTVLMKKDKMVEFDSSFESRDQTLYMVNNISMKGLAPGDYELDIVLHDVLEKDSSATQTVSFTIVPVAKVDTPAKEKGTDEPESPAVPESKPKTSKKSTKGSASSRRP